MADIYVKKTGNDSSGDGSSGSPYLTIGNAISEASNSDRIIIGGGVYAETNLGNNTSLTGIKICSLDTLVVISGSAGTNYAVCGGTNWVIDGSTGSNLHNIEILGAKTAVVGKSSGTDKSFSVKHCILTGKGNRRAYVEGSSIAVLNDTTGYGIDKAGGTTATIRNCVIRNLRYAFYNAASNAGAIKFINNICYDTGHLNSSTDYFGIEGRNSGSIIAYNTVVDFSGSRGISSHSSDIQVKNNLVCFVDLKASGGTTYGIYANGGGDLRFINNNVFGNVNSSDQTFNAIEDTNGSEHASNTTLDPNLKTTPRTFAFEFGGSSNFALTKEYRVYPGGPININGSNISGSGISIDAITTDFSGSARDSSGPSIGALEAPNIYDFDRPPKDAPAVKVKKDFTLNHYNRITDETPRNVDQIHFKPLKTAANLTDRPKAYRLTKETK